MAFSQRGTGYLGRSEIKDQSVKRALDDLASQIQAGFKQVNATPGGVTPAPPQISAIAVVAADGVFNVQIQDNNPVNRGIEYFIEFSTSPGGPWTVIALGASRNWAGFLGSQTLYWQAYSQYPTSDPSEPLLFGGSSSPGAVVGGGALAGPSPLPSAGSGTAPTNGQSGGSGFGKQPFRGKVQITR